MMMKVKHLILLWPKLPNGQMIGSYQFQQKNPKWLLITNKKSDSFESNFQFELGGKTRVFEALDLDINFNSQLTFTTHISIMITKAKQRLFLLKKSFQSKNPSIPILGFKTYIVPLLEYCSPVWNPHTIVEIRRIESVQRLSTKN